MAIIKTKTNITHLAKLAASELMETNETLGTAEPIGRSIAISQALMVNRSSAAKLTAAFLEDSSFGALRGGWLQRGDGGNLLQKQMLPAYLIDCALRGKGVGPIISQFRAFAKSPTCVIEWYTPIAGVRVKKSVKLDNHIHLLTWGDVPDSNEKEIFAPESTRTRLEFGLSQMRATASSVIRVRSTKRKVLFSSIDDAKSVIKDSEVNERTEKIRDAIRCITAQSTHAVDMIGSWSRFDRKIANALSFSGYSQSPTVFEPALWAASRHPKPLDGKATASLFKRFQKMSSPEQKVMRISLDRLNQALRRQNLVDKAIDLGIALEVILLHGINEGDRGEMRYRSSVRGATFLGENKAERTKIFKRLRDTYDLRSVAVHSGVIKSKKGKKSPEKILEEAIRDSVDIAKKLIDRGSFPDWDSEYVIDGK